MWLVMAKEKIKVPGTSTQEKEKLDCYFSLLTQDDNVVWFQAVGYSMLPLFWPGCRIRMNTDFESPEVGEVVVFADARKLIAHRVVAVDIQKQKWTTKGDTLCFFDTSINREDICGVVDFIDQNGKKLWVGSDPAVAALSARLGRILNDKFHFLPKIMKVICYCFFFFPRFISIQVIKK
jgi:hypothetical protein